MDDCLSSQGDLMSERIREDVKRRRSLSDSPLREVAEASHEALLERAKERVLSGQLDP